MKTAANLPASVEANIGGFGRIPAETGHPRIDITGEESLLPFEALLRRGEKFPDRYRAESASDIVVRLSMDVVETILRPQPRTIFALGDPLLIWPLHSSDPRFR